MNRTTIFITLQVLFSTIIFAQTSIGFKNKHHIKPISDYRLPQWGYSTILLDGWGMTKSSYYESNSLKVDNFEYQLSMKPSLLGYRESEKYIQNYQVDLSLDNFYASYKNKSESSRQENRKMDYELNLKGSRKQYLTQRGFLLIDATYHHKYQDHKTKEKGAVYVSDSREITRDYQAKLYLGVGFGRIRNISPLIRALRWRERYEALRDSFVITDDKIQLVGQEFSKISGYEVIYDRNDKYFWNNLFNHIDPNQSLTPFETFYLTDVLYENIGERFEGWEISIAAGKMRYNKDGEGLAGVLDFKWYKNLSLEDQIKIGASASYERRETNHTDNNYFYNTGYQFLPYINYLRLITDRITWNSGFEFQYFRGHIQHKYLNDNGDYSNRHSMYQLGSRFNYFIENGLNLFINFNYFYIDDQQKINDSHRKSDENSNALELRFGFYYIFNQKLF